MRQLIIEIKKHLQNSDIIWKSTEHELINTTHNYSLWIANTPKKNLKIYKPYEIEFSQEERDELIPLLGNASEMNLLKMIKAIDDEQKNTKTTTD